MGHAGSDVETVYRQPSDIEADLAHDPLLHTARQVLDAGLMSKDEVLSLYNGIDGQVHNAMENAAQRPRLKTAQEVAAPIIPKPITPKQHDNISQGKAAPSSPEMNKPVHMSKMISLTLAEQMQQNSNIVIFGEDVGKKGGVYGATVKLQQTFGRSRVFDSLLDEQTILGMAIGLAHNKFLPIPEIQFLAYVHNAEDQIRGEAATLSFFSKGQYTNPMVIRIAGLGYQKGFGGHFHNDNSLNVFRDIPGLIMGCPSNPSDAARMLREAIRLAHEEQRIVVMIEPIALYNVKDLHSDGDGLMTAKLADTKASLSMNEAAVYGEAGPCDAAIVSYGNGAYMSRRVKARLEKSGLNIRVIDLRWLLPLPFESLLTAIKGAKNILIVDECRKTGSIAEELVTRLYEAGATQKMMRLNAEDCFIPLGSAANEVLLSEQQVEDAVISLTSPSQPKGL